MTSLGLAIEVQHAAVLCHALHQAAFPWLQRLQLHNRGGMAQRALELVVTLAPVLPEPWRQPVDEIPAGASLAIAIVDLPLSAEAFANLVEGERAELVVRVERAGEVLAVSRTPIDLLAYNEWPGLQPVPALLATFVAPNHPALSPLQKAMATSLAVATGQPALDGYQSGSPERVRAMLAAAHEAVVAAGITYVVAPPSFERTGQKVRTPEQVVGERIGNCLDLALLYAALLEAAGLQPFVVVQRRHAFVGVWTLPAATPQVELGPAVELKKRVEAGAVLVLECTLACAGQAASPAQAQAAAAKHLANDAEFLLAIDVAAARSRGFRPLPVRTSAFRPVDVDLDPSAPSPVAVAGSSAAPTFVDDDQEAPRPESPPAAPSPPGDRLEHWKGRLLDLSMFNRLLNFAETKKTLRLCTHDLEVLEDRLQQGGRVRVLPRPDLGQGAGERDLALASQRAGVDVLAEHLADELRAGRLRAELDAESLDDRLVEIYRHARISLEESGANTLYLALGFLKYYESPGAEKPRRAPLLLLPLVVERASVTEGCRFVLDDAEPRLNQTLRQFLLRDFDLRVPLGDTPPEGDNGVDVKAVLDAFRAVALRMPRWEVETTACIGFFSFTKYLMWLDLAARDELLQSPVLQHLVERPGTAFAQDAPEFVRERLDELDPAEVLCPKDADSSQLAAVLAAAKGRSFVLEGPPGTGKSQTITNLIAQALADGQRVLFVAEKRAALEVVQRRLAEVGLGPFCLELHSSKSGPKAVLEQLRAALEAGQRREPAEWRQCASDLLRTRNELNALVADLHRPREHGASVFSAMSELIALRAAPRVALPVLATAEPAAVAAAFAAVAELAGVAAPIGVPAASPWWGVRRADWTPALQREVPAAGARLAAAAERLAGAVAAFAGACGLLPLLGAGPSRDQLQHLVALWQLLKAPALPPSALLRIADWRTFAGELQRAGDEGAQRDAAWAPLAARWRRELLQRDLDRLAADVQRAAGSFVLLRWWRFRGPRAELAAVAVGQVPPAALCAEDLQAALRVRALERSLLARAAVAQALGGHWRASLADWAQVAAFAKWVDEVRRLLVQLQPGALAPSPEALVALATQLDGLAEGADALPRVIAAAQTAHDEWLAARGAVQQLLQLDDDEAFGAAAAPGFCAAVVARTSRWRDAGPALRDFCAYRSAADAAAATGVAPLVAAHARGEVATGQLVASARATFLDAWLDRVHAAEPALARFRGADHERTIARFAQLDQQAIRLSAEVVRARLASRVPQLRDTQVASSELGVLERELKKQRKHKPVRKLFAEIPGLLSRLAPCMLMSPLSVAQYLGRASTRFDLVVFDEASQIPMWDAVGAIGRGDALVVVGDSRQLPPTTFFQRQAQGDEPAPDELPEDLESVLDECSAAGLPRLHLDWHYRSRHESLIAFSNHHYYKNRLLTFPAPEARGHGLGVRTVRVAGIYDRAGSQQNRIEAEALVADVVARLLDPARARQSLGVVTFSQAQQVLIEDLLDQARRQRPELEAAFTAASEPVFVKNLENVQGDERDVILFSICYGPDAQGRVFENYGPLNTQGGERRLNVAVTRARRELVVFTSVGPEQVANRTQALGARHLRTFLDYALRGTEALPAATTLDPGRGVDSPFEAAVRDALAQRGHEVHTQVGCSGYRIDLAVVDPGAAGRYLLGIECDGASYHSAANARDRDRLRAAVLRGLGWHLHRVWSTDFWLDPAGEIDRLEAAIAAAKARVVAAELPPRLQQAVVVTAPAAAVPVEAVAPASAPAPLDDPDGPRPYAEVALAAVGTAEQFALPAALPQLRRQVAEVLAGEAPVHLDRLARVVAAAWQVARVTERVRERLRSALPATAVVDGDVVWADDAQRTSFRGFRVPDEKAGDDAARRPFDELPPAEIEHAMRWLLRQHQALGRDDLARETARCFGITRLGAVVKDVMAANVERAVQAGRLVERDRLLREP